MNALRIVTSFLTSAPVYLVVRDGGLITTKELRLPDNHVLKKVPTVFVCFTKRVRVRKRMRHPYCANSVRGQLHC